MFHLATLACGSSSSGCSGSSGGSSPRASRYATQQSVRRLARAGRESYAFPTGALHRPMRTACGKASGAARSPHSEEGASPGLASPTCELVPGTTVLALTAASFHTYQRYADARFAE